MDDTRFGLKTESLKKKHWYEGWFLEQILLHKWSARGSFEV